VLSSEAEREHGFKMNKPGVEVVVPDPVDLTVQGMYIGLELS